MPRSNARRRESRSFERRDGRPRKRTRRVERPQSQNLPLIVGAALVSLVGAGLVGVALSSKGASRAEREEQLRRAELEAEYARSREAWLEEVKAPPKPSGPPELELSFVRSQIPTSAYSEPATAPLTGLSRTMAVQRMTAEHMKGPSGVVQINMSPEQRQMAKARAEALVELTCRVQKRVQAAGETEAVAIVARHYAIEWHYGAKAESAWTDAEVDLCLERARALIPKLRGG